jgi:NitT/TauT family transport system permease protein
MADQPATNSSPQPPVGLRPPERGLLRRLRGFFGLRKEIPLWQEVLFGLLFIALCFGLWWFVTRGEEEERIVPSSKGLPSPQETFASFPSLWFDRELTRNTLASLKRVVLGFGLAALIGIPLGVLCGCFPRINAFFNPLSLFGRNIPIAALIPLTFAFFGVGELEKVMFIFIACVAFILSDTARAVADVSSAYVDTAYTLGANRWQVILKVLVPLAMPSIFNSLRLLFGLAFGYIMLAEAIKLGSESGGLGDIIIMSQRRGPREHIILILLVIPVVALGIDRILFWAQKELFPYRYGGSGTLNHALGAVLHAWDDCKTWLWRRPAPALGLPQDRQPEQGKP